MAVDCRFRCLGIGEYLFDVDKSGAEKIEANSSSMNKQRLMEMYADEYRYRFEENMDWEVPTHPWHIFVELREEVREIFPSGSDERHERVFVLEQLFDRFKDRWETYRANFDRGMD